MITAEDERVHDGGDFLAVHLWDARGERFWAVSATRTAQSESASALRLHEGHEPETGPASVGTDTPLERWHLEIEAPERRIAVGLHALSAPLDLSATSGERRYVQLCEASGDFAGFGVRAHAWGRGGAQRRRFVSAAVPGGAFLSVAAARPDDAVAHGEELVGGYIVDAGSGGEPRPFETVRLSTVYDAGGLPRTAGLELYRPGEELPERAAGRAVWSGPGLSFFRWTLEGTEAWGTYEVEQAS